jgi:TonB family protein
MFEKSRTWQRYSGESTKIIRLHLGHVPQLDERPEEDKFSLRLALGVAFLAHLSFFLVQLPHSAAPSWTKPKPKVYLVNQVRFRPPPPVQQEQIPLRREQRRVIPIPDPTPDDPEPLVVDEVVVPELEIVDFDLGLGIPEAPTASLVARSRPLRVNGSVLPPRKIFAPWPPYTEEARKSRIQGVVILEAIIDAMGNVTEVKVLKGLPEGLTDSAVASIHEWRFKPATLDGRPVPVFFNLSIKFSLQ